MDKKIVFCNCGGEIISKERLQTIEDSLTGLNVELEKLSDLCGLSAMRKDKLNEVFTRDAGYLLIGCHSRSLKLLIGNAGVDSKPDTLRYISFLDLTDAEILKEAEEFSKNTDCKTGTTEIISDPSWPSWFPVIDYSRCSSCGQCADFCLFGVYEKNEGRVNVVNPAECKNNCPACARICPQTAIIFPKYKEGGAISGSDVIDEISEQQRQTQDINTFLNGDIYSALERRKNRRRSIIRDEEMRKAHEERNDALGKK